MLTLTLCLMNWGFFALNLYFYATTGYVLSALAMIPSAIAGTLLGYQCVTCDDPL